MIRRLIAFIIGIFFMGLGIAVITKSNLGTSPISTLPYVISFIAPWSFGLWSVLLSVLFIMIQMFLLKTITNPALYAQLLVSPFLGVAIDIGMFLLASAKLNSFIMQILFLVFGCIVLAIGIYAQIEARLIMNPGESLVSILSTKLGYPFGTVKIIFDWSLVLSATIIGMIVLKSPTGVGIGTIIAAFLVGYIIKLIYKLKKVNQYKKTASILERNN